MFSEPLSDKGTYKLVLFTSIFICILAEETTTISEIVNDTEKSISPKWCDDVNDVCNYSNPLKANKYEMEPNNNCMCDSECNLYGDCCPTSIYYDNKTYRRPYRFSCPQFFSFYIINVCPDSWKSEEISRKCRKSGSEPIVEADLINSLPVISLENNLTYGNKYCAICNGQLDYRSWIKKYNNDDRIPEINFADKRISVNAEGRFVNESAISPADRFILNPPDGYSVRKCIPNVVNDCDERYRTEALSQKCSDHMLLRYDSECKAYKNEYCFMCNNDNKSRAENLTNCRQQITVQRAIVSFTILFRSPPLFDQKNSSHSAPPEIADNFSQTSPVDETSYSSTVVSYVKGTRCRTGIFNRSQCTIDPADGTLRHPRVSRNITDRQYFAKDELIVVCLEEAGSEPSTIEDIVTMICVGVSIVSLIVYLSLFGLLKQLRNFAGKNLASYSLALLLAYGSFAIGSYVRYTACAVAAVFTYYFFSVSFFSMLVVSFDLWKSFWNVTRNLKLSGGKKPGTFLAYSILQWTVPALLVLSSVLLDVSADKRWSWLKPRFGLTACWFGNEQALVAFFIAPFCIVMSLNLFFYTHTALMLYSAQSNASAVRSSATRKYDFRMYVKLALLMGLTWTSAFLAMHFEHSALWMLFIVLNACQGLFILLAFGLSARIIQNVSEKFSNSVGTMSFFSSS